ncbi:hypothetical protein SASPL_104561 [Salvia splendens]|uniref:GH3 C-terminal domain-containing protein n=1 Tax=Salvia splendens TaxID=180675 RepID=A0A8X8YN17_SALSN|nr:hypothetical protein SASPL_104561 [Salvia splendens]
MVTYEDIQPLIQTIANGDRSPILSARPISEFLTSSGTSAGEIKLMPTISEEWDRRRILYSLLMPVMDQPVLTSYYKSDIFKNRPYDPFTVYTSPNEAILPKHVHPFQHGVQAGAMEIRLVRSGTFEELMDYALSKGASINQYKVPRCVTVELLDSRVVSTHFSPERRF